jgi:hypothetical protein
MQDEGSSSLEPGPSSLECCHAGAGGTGLHTVVTKRYISRAALSHQLGEFEAYNHGGVGCWQLISPLAIHLQSMAA